MKLRIYLSLSIIALVLLVALGGCGGGGSSSATGALKGATGGGTGGTWTVLVYLDADNDLEQFGIDNFNQMEQVGSTGNVKIVVQIDRIAGFDASNDNWTGCRRYLVTKDTDPNIIHSQLLQDMGEVDMGNPTTLRDFISWGQKAYPADRCCLVLWNHGSGWRSAKTGAQSRNIAFDDTSGTSINTSDLPSALSSAVRPFDLVAIDASLMQMVEVAYEIRNNARFVVGSEESPPGLGYPYHEWLAPLVATPSMGPAELGTVISQKYVQFYQVPPNVSEVTQSVLDESKITAVASAANDLAAAILPHATTDAAALKTARENSQAYPATSPLSFEYRDLLDYANLVNQLVPDPAITSAKNKLQSALSSAVVFESHFGNTESRSHGLSVYVPIPGDYISRYETLSFTQDFPNWATWLKAQQQ